jgi:UDP-N-acetylglucosamine diphosphorylase/glucosamine-1-phosphate N-acetyltransferase
MNICIFEDFFISRLAPLNHLRHTSELICGVFTTQEKISGNFPGKTPLTLHSRKYIAEGCRENFPKARINALDSGEYIFLNSRVLFSGDELKEIVKKFRKVKNSAIIQGDEKTIIAFHTTADKTEKYKELINGEDDNLVTYSDIEWLGLSKIESSNYKMINYPSDLIIYFEDEIKRDMLKLSKGRKKLHVSNKAKVAKNVVFDTSEGSIYIDKNTVIEPFSFIKGPVYIGQNSTVRSGTRLYGPVRIGDRCKVSGEITNSILHSYVNKQHYGFLGHSYLCSWVNLGAGTTTSNLKNNYSIIELTFEQEKIKTDTIFLGSIIGDHTKTGIMTMLNTGTLVGISSNLFGPGYHKKFIRSFIWDDSATGEESEYDINKAIGTAKTTMKRRGIEMSSVYEKMFQHIFEKKDGLII